MCRICAECGVNLPELEIKKQNYLEILNKVNVTNVTNVTNVKT